MPEVIRIAVLGAGGRMGRAVIAAVLDDARFRLVAAQTREDSEYAGRDAATLAGRPACGIVLGTDLAAVIRAADVAIDFTRPGFTTAIASAAAEAGVALVSGTTGMDATQRAALEAAAARIPLLWAPNMSIGVNLLLAALVDIAARAGEGYDAEIIETHHRHKIDAPSGTAIALGEALAAARGSSLAELADHGSAARQGARAPGRIGMHSIRAGEIVGEHEVRLVSAGEEIRLGHTAFNRGAFATGALRAAAWLHDRAPGLYGMSELLGLPRERR